MENKIIYINIVAAADRILAHHPIPSKDQYKPTQLPHSFFYMVVSGAAMDIQGDGTGDMTFSAMQGDVLRVGMTNEFGNYEMTVILYDTFLYPVNGVDPAPIFGGAPFRLESFPEVTTPHPVAFQPLQTANGPQSYHYAENTFQQRGTAGVGYRFAIYRTPRGGTPELVGYFQWDPAITVK